MQMTFNLDSGTQPLERRLQEGWKVVFVINHKRETYLILEKK